MLSFEISMIFMNVFCRSLRSIVTYTSRYIPNPTGSTLINMDSVVSFFFSLTSLLSGSTKSNAFRNKKHGTNLCIWNHCLLIYLFLNYILQNPQKLINYYTVLIHIIFNWPRLYYIPTVHSIIRYGNCNR